MKFPATILKKIRVFGLLALLMLSACGTPTVENPGDAPATANDANVAQADGESGDVGVGQDTAVEEPPRRAQPRRAQRRRAQH